MEDWKITLAEGITSYSKYGNKDVKIVTKNNKTGGEVAKAVLAGINTSYPLSTDFKGLSKTPNSSNKWWVIGIAEAVIGIPMVGAGGATGVIATQDLIDSGWKTFYVHTGSKQAQDEFIERLGKVIAEVNEYKNLAPVAVTSGGNDSDTRRNNILLIAAAVLIIAAIVWALWK